MDLGELKDQQRELNRKLLHVREQEVEKALKDFMQIILDGRMPLEIKETSIVESYKATILNIFHM